jgi:PAS domain S-box-containing protein
VTGLFIVTEEAPKKGDKLAVDLTTSSGDVLHLHGRVAGLHEADDAVPRGRGFALALESYNEAYERLLLALSSPSGAFPRPKRKLELVPGTPPDAVPVLDPGLVRILVVDPSERGNLALREATSKIEVGSFRLEWVVGAREGLAALADRRHDIAFVSWRVAPSGGLALIRSALAAGCEIPLVLLTNVHDRRLELEAVREGAADTVDLAHLDPDMVEHTIRTTLERARADASRRAGERELADLYDKAPCGYQTLDEKGAILRMNETALSWLGYDREELVGVKRFSELLEPGSVPKYHEQVRWFLEPGRLRDVSLTLRRRDGSLLPVSASAILVKPQGQRARSRWTLLDMTERHEREAAMRRLARAIETMQTGVVITDLFGKILYANPSFADLFGFAVAELVGSEAHRLVPPDIRSGAFRPLSGATRSRREVKALKKDGAELPVQLVSDVVFDELGAPFAVVTCCEDRSRVEDRRARLSRATRERLVEQLGSAESTIRSLSEVLLDGLSEEEGEE